MCAATTHQSGLRPGIVVESPKCDGSSVDGLGTNSPTRGLRGGRQEATASRVLSTAAVYFHTIDLPVERPIRFLPSRRRRLNSQKSTFSAETNLFPTARHRSKVNQGHVISATLLDLVVSEVHQVHLADVWNFFFKAADSTPALPMYATKPRHMPTHVFSHLN